MMKLDRLVGILERIAPPELADAMDEGKIGLCVRGADEVKKAVTALDPTMEVIKKVVEGDAQLLVVHHPLIWEPVSLIRDDIAQKLKLLLKNDISLYAMHTNYDRAHGGVNDVLAGLLGLREVVESLDGRIGFIEEMTLEEFAKGAGRILGCPVEYVGSPGKKVRKIALVAGSGFRAGMDVAIAEKADVLLSSELKHDVIRGRGDVALVSAPHYHTEAPAMRALAGRLCEHVEASFIEDATDIRVVAGFERRRVR